jgi:hypothetical protein
MAKHFDTEESAREAGYFPADQCKNYNPERYDIFWTDDYAYFLPVALTWWDDASYARYQGDFCDE